MGGVRPGNLTAKRIVAAAQSGKYKNMACVAREVAVSRERVRQVLNATGHTNFGSRHVSLQWPCPDCGQSINITPSRLQVHMPAHCQKCAKSYCGAGHLRSKHARKNGRCGVCERSWRRRIVEVRTCLECNDDLEISWGVRSQIRLGLTRGDFHRQCYYANVRRVGRPASRKSHA